MIAIAQLAVWITALGPCTRPTDAQRDAIQRHVDRWLARSAGGALAPLDGTTRPNPSFAFGCVEADGIVVDVSATVLAESPDDGTVEREGRWWTLRVTGREVRVIARAAVRDASGRDGYVETMALVELHHDGALVPILARSDGGPRWSDYDVWIPGGRVVHLDGVRGGPSVDRVQGDAVVIELDRDDGRGMRHVLVRR